MSGHFEWLKQWVSMDFYAGLTSLCNLNVGLTMYMQDSLYIYIYLTRLVFVMAAQGIFAAFVNGWYYESLDKTLVSNS